MQSPAFARYGFRIRTRAGLVMDRLQIPGRDLPEAERKVQQLYRDCVILESYGMLGVDLSAFAPARALG